MSDPTCKDATNGETLERPFHQDDAALQEFSGVMLEKLRANKHKAHWSHVDSDWLLGRLEQELKELREAMASGDGLSVVYECADVANFAMMIADKEWIKDDVR